MIDDAWREATRRLSDAALADDTAYRRLAYLCDRIGPRLGGSKGLERAIAWTLTRMRRDGLEDVHAEPVKVPHWVRGKESATLLSPLRRPLTMLGLGMSVGTPRGGIAADVLVVSDFDELARRGGAAAGKIVCFNAPFTSYGATVAYRLRGASEAAKVGAVAALIRSVGPPGFQTPHTGTLRYEDGVAQIPAAAITIEDAEALARMQARGEKPRVRLSMQARTLPDADSANVVAQWRGRERPDEIVLIGAHLDSWDICPGSHDDGGGCLICWEALRLMKVLDLRPRRTVRVVLFTNEENGLRGGTGYRDRHRNELARHVLAIESDAGVTRPLGFGVSVDDASLAAIRSWSELLAPSGATAIVAGGGGADIGPIGAEGVPTASLNVDLSLYWKIHHTPADTMEKVDPAEMARCVAALAVFAYSVAEMPATLTRG